MSDEKAVNPPPASPGESSALSSFMTARPVAITMVFVAAMVFGFFSYGRLPVTLMPELSDRKSVV